MLKSIMKQIEKEEEEPQSVRKNDNAYKVKAPAKNTTQRGLYESDESNFNEETMTVITTVKKQATLMSEASSINLRSTSE